MSRSKTMMAVGPLLRHRFLRLLLIIGPAITAAVGTFTASESNLLVAAVLNAAAGVIICGTLLLVLSVTARRVADGQLNLVRSIHEGRLSDWARLGIIRQRSGGLYPDWYFHLRLEEERDRAQRYGLHFTVLVLTRPRTRESMSEWFAAKIQPQLRKTDLPALLEDNQLAVLLLQTQRASAMRRRLATLPAFGGTVGFACFPEDGDDVATLLDTAMGNAAGVDPEQASDPSTKNSPRRIAA